MMAAQLAGLADDADEAGPGTSPLDEGLQRLRTLVPEQTGGDA
jgi:hypothetical protein